MKLESVRRCAWLGLGTKHVETDRNGKDLAYLLRGDEGDEIVFQCHSLVYKQLL